MVKINCQQSYRRVLIVSLIMSRRRQLAAKKRKRQIRRDLYIRNLFQNRTEHGELWLVKDLASDPLYHWKYFRMTKATFDELYELVKDDLMHMKTHSHPIPALLRFALTIRYLAGGSSQISLAFNYRISPPSVSNIVRETLRAIILALKNNYLPRPTPALWSNSEAMFRNRWDFPFCIGAIDGKHVRIKAPFRSGSANYNYKSFFSVVLLGIVGADYKFLGVDFGACGSESDSGYLSNSVLGKKIDNGGLLFPEDGLLPGSQEKVPHVIVGDGGFSLSTRMMRPYPRKTPELLKKVFNYRLSRARRVSENGFGIWAARWRILYTAIDADLDLVHLIIEATLILHNFLREKADTYGLTTDTYDDNGNIVPGSWRQMLEENVGVSNIPRIGSNNYSSTAEQIRGRFATFFSSEHGEKNGQVAYVMRGKD